MSAHGQPEESSTARRDEAARGESPIEQLDRNWADLLQELRVLQTGVQLLTGFLLTLPLQQRFAGLTAAQENIYLGTVALSVAATVVLIAPVSLHRFLFRRHARRALVQSTHRLAQFGSLLLGCAVVGVVLFIFDIVRGPTTGVVAAALTAVLVLALWLALPLNNRQRPPRPAERDRP
ncbi:hypothetical protein SAMN04515671_4279 [Nakamurella panacisegetis]|uniref:Sodium:proton antiporter n=1 Tax=Nakamurella panacisegetis TaxID=1090615 RepID=A0A1H0SUJ7_9ACTN|nr:DUF6328 family protein [Nakamurella panacisegetis]SDP44946.1 hypothetical protein SAMN04515671_4279 [Nakamurella panacisegetis]